MFLLPLFTLHPDPQPSSFFPLRPHSVLQTAVRGILPCMGIRLVGFHSSMTWCHCWDSMTWCHCWDCILPGPWDWQALGCIRAKAWACSHIVLTPLSFLFLCKFPSHICHLSIPSFGWNVTWREWSLHLRGAGLYAQKFGNVNSA